MNVILSNSDWKKTDIKTLFCDEDVIFSNADDIQSLMVEFGVYPSKTKSINAGRKGDIPSGWTVFKASKKVTMWIWNPQ